MKNDKSALKNGKALAAILSAAIGSFFGLFAIINKRRHRCAKQDKDINKSKKAIKNGRAMATILSTGVGSFIIGLITLMAKVSEAVEETITFYQPSGSLSGISTLTVAGWLVSWIVFYYAWRNHNINFNSVFVITFILMGLGLLFMFPPFFKMFS